MILGLDEHYLKLLLVLGWDVIIDTLLETDFVSKNGNAEDGGAAAHLVSSLIFRGRQ